MRNVNVRGAIYSNTIPPHTLWYATMDGRIWVGKNGKTVYLTKGGLKSALTQSSICREVMKCANNYADFQNLNAEGRRRIQNKFWREFRKDNTGRIQIHSFIPNLENK